MKPARKGPPATVDAYLAALAAPQRAALERLRRLIHAAAPRAEEAISYGIPAFRWGGKWLLYLAAGAKHCAIYGVPELKELAAHDTTGRGTLRFAPDQPLPATLVRKLVKARLAALTARAEGKKPAVSRGRRRTSRASGAPSPRG